MKVKDLVELLLTYDNDDDDEIEIEVYETGSGKYVDTTAAISAVEDDVWVPTFRIDVEAGKFKPFL